MHIVYTYAMVRKRYRGRQVPRAPGENLLEELLVALDITQCCLAKENRVSAAANRRDHRRRPGDHSRYGLPPVTVFRSERRILDRSSKRVRHLRPRRPRFREPTGDGPGIRLAPRARDSARNHFGARIDTSSGTKRPGPMAAALVKVSSTAWPISRTAPACSAMLL
jgi:hypothetical protein